MSDTFLLHVTSVILPKDEMVMDKDVLVRPHMIKSWKMFSNMALWSKVHSGVHCQLWWSNSGPSRFLIFTDNFGFFTDIFRHQELDHFSIRHQHSHQNWYRSTQTLIIISPTLYTKYMGIFWAPQLSWPKAKISPWPPYYFLNQHQHSDHLSWL